ncbi:RAVE protein 1 C terminal-domain-containing protein [Tuber brumale]|nr:RAVE protein 1 C terminal-domain-containing protein [Tuber brumale]
MALRSVLLPGKPQSNSQAVCTVEWGRKRIIAYVSGCALVLLGSVDRLIQTIYHDVEVFGVAVDEISGKIATVAKGRVFVYAPTGGEERFLKWVLQSQIEIEGNTRPSTVSWGGEEELLVGNTSLTLWNTRRVPPKNIWEKLLANQVHIGEFSYDASLIASVGESDRLVKIWRRPSLCTGDVQFDFSYLPHPRAVTRIHWRRPFSREQSVDNVLYTIAADGVLRVWAPVYPHDLHLLQLWAVIDLRESIPDGLCDEKTMARRSDTRYVMIVDGCVFTHAVESAVCSVDEGERGQQVFQRLVEVAKRSPEICVVFDGRGRMSAWGLENVGCRARKTTNVFSVMHAENSGMEFVAKGEQETFVQFHCFLGGAGLMVLAHVFDGRVFWYEARLDRFLDPSPRPRRASLLGVLTGHSGPIETLVRTPDGKSMLSSTRENELMVWSQSKGDNIALSKQSSISPASRVHRAVILDNGNYVMTLHDGHVVLWDSTQSVAKELERLYFKVAGKMLCLLLLPEAQDGLKQYHVVALSSEMKGIAWGITLPQKPSELANGINDIRPTVHEFATFALDMKEDLLMILPVDPVGWNATISGTLDTFSREVVVTVDKSGLLQSWTAKASPDESGLRWLATSTVDTSIENPSLAKGNSIRKIALVNSGRSELTIWDSRAAQLEYQQHFESQDVIQDLDWTSTPDSQSILAVGFPHRVLLMCQLRYDYLSAGPAWASFRQINIRDITPHPIGDSLWLSNGSLVIGAGNQLFIYSRKVEELDDLSKKLQLSSLKARLDDIFEIVSHLNGPVPVYHPQFLQQCILAGKSGLVEEILVRLHKELKNFHEEIPLDNFLEIPIDTFLTREEDLSTVKRTGKLTGGFFSSYQEEEELLYFDEPLAKSLCSLLTKIHIPHLMSTEQINLAGIVECVAQVKEHRRSIDENGARYLLSFRQHGLRREPADMSYREFVWAFHSASQEILIDLVNINAKGKMMWPQARESGIFMWLRDPEAIHKHFEVIARNHYTSTFEKNPIDCSLHYLALKKKNVLIGLWRMASWNREQASTQRFLANNFSDPRWKTAAMKNAYALMGKHRFEYAAAFFLLADSLKDAVNVCFDRMNDMQLAIAVARVYEGDNGPVLRALLQDRILPLAVENGNRWLATWAFWMLRRKDMAVRCLLSPLRSLTTQGTDSPSTPTKIEARLFLADDPALVILYRQIREKTLQTLRGVEKISPGAEFQFLLHTARLYDRMGCDLLALDLVRNWEFLRTSKDAHKPLIQFSPRHHFRRRSSITVVDEPPPAASIKLGITGIGGGVGGTAKPPVAVFEEPSMDWAF